MARARALLGNLPLRPARGGFLRPFGCGWFIREFLLGYAPNGSPRIDLQIGLGRSHGQGGAFSLPGALPCRSASQVFPPNRGRTRGQRDCLGESLSSSLWLKAGFADGSCFCKAINLLRIGGEFLVHFGPNTVQMPVQMFVQ